MKKKLYKFLPLLCIPAIAIPLAGCDFGRSVAGSINSQATMNNAAGGLDDHATANNTDNDSWSISNSAKESASDSFDGVSNSVSNDNWSYSPIDSSDSSNLGNTIEDTYYDTSSEDLYYNTYTDEPDYKRSEESDFIATSVNAFSTFGADVDTASYNLFRSRMHNYLNNMKYLQNTSYKVTKENFIKDLQKYHKISVKEATDMFNRMVKLYKSEFGNDNPFGGNNAEEGLLELIKSTIEFAQYDIKDIKKSLRIEEVLNYFDYDYPNPKENEKFGVTQTITDCPWNKDNLIYHVGIKAEEKEPTASNLVFLVDTSGSMLDDSKLGLAKKALKLIADRMDGNNNNRISIVTYAGSDTVLLEGATRNDKDRIISAIDDMEAGGGTNGSGGITKAYEIAEKYFIEGGNNRIILATDGDFNVGVTSEEELIELVDKKRESNIFLSCLGFGSASEFSHASSGYSDVNMEALADHGNGNYTFIDSSDEASRTLVKEFASTLYTVAKDVKFQIEFNPDTVESYRKIGYENRELAKEDFEDDTKDGGEIGSGQTVTILYEIVPKKDNTNTNATESDNNVLKLPDSKTLNKDDYALLNIRYKEPESDKSILNVYHVNKKDKVSKQEINKDASWAINVADAIQVYTYSEHNKKSTYDTVIKALKEHPDIMTDNYKADFVYMIEKIAESENLR